MRSLRFFLTLFFGTVSCVLFAQEIKNYANTPDTLLPFYQFQKPYKQFFDVPLQYNGAARDKKIPTNLKTVKLGFLGPLDESTEGSYGKEMLKGAQLALELRNKNGGYHGTPFELLVNNDVGLWGASGNELVKMDDQGVWAVLGSVDGNNTHVAIRVALKLELPIVNSGTTDPTLTETNIPWVIRCVADDRQQNYALALHMFREKGFKNVAVFRANNRYGRVGSKEFVDAARRLGHPIQLHLRYQPGDTAVTEQLLRIKNSSAEAVLIWGNDDEAALIVNRMKELGMKQQVFGCDRIISKRFLEMTGKNAEGIVATSLSNPDSKEPDYLAFVKLYEQKYGEKPGVFAAHAWDGMNILFQSIDKAGLNKALIRDELTSIGKYEGVTGEIIFDATWNDVGQIWMAEVKNGKYVFRPVILKVQ